MPDNSHRIVIEGGEIVYRLFTFSDVVTTQAEVTRDIEYPPLSQSEVEAMIWDDVVRRAKEGGESGVTDR